MSRPSIYTPELAAEICARLESGESLRRICEDESMPCRSTVLRWMERDDDFATKCARAREDQAEYMDDLILDTAKSCTPENFQVARVQISAYQWRAAKLKPKKYGDKIAQEVSGPGGGPIYVIGATEASEISDKLDKAV
jgi:hypothetical protein